MSASIRHSGGMGPGRCSCGKSWPRQRPRDCLSTSRPPRRPSACIAGLGLKRLTGLRCPSPRHRLPQSHTSCIGSGAWSGIHRRHPGRSKSTGSRVSSVVVDAAGWFPSRSWAVWRNCNVKYSSALNTAGRWLLIGHHLASSETACILFCNPGVLVGELQLDVEAGERPTSMFDNSVLFIPSQLVVRALQECSSRRWATEICTPPPPPPTYHLQSSPNDAESTSIVYFFVCVVPLPAG